MNGSIRIGVVGAGTAGAASATILARAGHEVTVFERVPKPGPVGAGITLQPTGQATLVKLGLFDAVKDRGARIDRLHVMRRPKRNTMMDLPYSDVDPELFGIGIHRGVLFLTLHRALVESPAKLVCGVAIASSDVKADGRWLVDDKGERYGPYDLVIAADGSVCELHHCAPRVTSTPYAWGACWLVRDDPDDFFTKQGAIHQIVDGPMHMLGILPTGKGPTGDKNIVSLFWSIKADRVPAWKQAGLAAWRDQVLSFEPRAEAILDTLDDLEPVVFTQYRDVAMWPWHGDRIVFLGDAAHATSPQLGQGANLAMIDAVTFAECVADHPDVATAVAAYSTARRRHLNYYQFATRALTPFFQSDSRILGFMRDVTFPWSKWLRPLRRRMVRTMLGIDRGILRRPIPLAEIKQRLLASGHD